MPIIPSENILAKHLIGQGVELSGVSNSAILERPNRVAYYNFAIMELYNVLGLIDSEEYVSIVANQSAASGDFAEHGSFDFTSANYKQLDKLITIEFVLSEDETTVYDSEQIGVKDFIRHKRLAASESGAIEPYDETIIWTFLGTNLHFLIGKTLAKEYDDFTADFYFRRQPTLLTVAAWDTAYMDAPDKYLTLLALRIASLFEQTQGITDKSIVMVKNAYELLLANVDLQTRNKILASIVTPEGMMHDVQGSN